MPVSLQRPPLWLVVFEQIPEPTRQFFREWTSETPTLSKRAHGSHIILERKGRGRNLRRREAVGEIAESCAVTVPYAMVPLVSK